MELRAAPLFQHPATTGNLTPRSPETELWKAVFVQAATDAAIPYPCPARSEARRWFRFAQEDVALVLEFCGYDIEALREGLEAMIASWDSIEAQPPSSRRRGGRRRKAVSVSPAPRSKQRRASNA